MRAPRLLCLVLVAGLAAVPSPAPAQAPPIPAAAADALRFIQRAGIQYALLAARSAVDLTYEGVSVDPRSGAVVVDGLSLRPRLDWDPDRTCEIAVERIALPDGAAGGLETIAVVAELDGLSVATACLEPGPGLAVQSFGYDRILLDNASLSLDYHMPSAGAALRIAASMPDAARLTVTADFDYLWFTGVGRDGAREEPRPVAKLRAAELVLENEGLWERVSPVVEGQVGNLDALPQMIRALLGSALAGPGGQPGPEARAFIDNAAEEIARFTREGDRIVLSVAPPGGVWLGEDLLQTPAQALAALRPRLSAAPGAVVAMIPPSRLSAALGEGADPSRGERLAIGRALLTGVGAPLSPEEGLALVTPLAEDWHGEAAMLVAETAADRGDTARAYAMALRARAGGAPGAAGLLARLGARLSAGDVIAAQEAAFDAWPGKADWQAERDAAVEAGDVAALHAMAADAAAGRGMPASHTQAYYLAGLAAAAGDRAAAALRDRIAARFTRPDGTPAPGWAEARSAAARATLETWTQGGLAGRIADRYGLGE